jgi:glycosyltransferase involved in cell wall biosynthesis
MNNPLISIIIPFYNSGDIISNSVSSLNSQTSKNFEVIFVNDGSKDNSLEILKKLLNNCNFNYKIINKINEGVSIARNIGIKESRTDYLMFLDCDDFLDKNLIIEIEKTFNNDDNLDILYWGWDRINQNKIVIEKYDKNFKYLKRSRSFVIDYMKKNFWIWTGSALYRKKFLLENDIKFPNNVAFAEDVFFIFNAILKAKKIDCMNKSMSYYFVNDASISQNFSLKRLSIIRVMYLLEIQLFDRELEKKVFLEEFKPAFYWNLINGLLDYKGNDENLKMKIINLIKNKFIYKELKKYKPKDFKNKFRKILILYFPKFFLEFKIYYSERGILNGR